MANARLISKRLSTSRKFAALADTKTSLGEFAQVLYVLLIAHADDFGRLDGDAWTVKHEVVPASRRQISDVEKSLKLLSDCGLIDRYVIEDVTVIQINDFEQHQQGLHRRTASRFPESPGKSGKVPLNRTEQNRTERIASREVVGKVPETDAGFAEFWAAYPRKANKPAALRAWHKHAPDAPLLGRILSAVVAQRGSPQWVKEGGAFIPYPASWLNGERWNDTIEVPALAAPPGPMGSVLEPGYRRRCETCGQDFEPPRYPDGSVMRIYSCAACQLKAASDLDDDTPLADGLPAPF